MKLRVMSNNQWWADTNKPAWAEAGLDCSAAVRAPGFARMIRETAPDIAGLQECTKLMADLLMLEFADTNAGYALLWGRDTPILYKTDKFELVDSAYLLYPEAVPGFEGEFNNLKTKSYCIAALRSKENGKMLIFGTTHLWYMSGDPSSKSYRAGSDEARAYQLGLLMDKAEEFGTKYDCPIILVGDMNAYLGSIAVRRALERGYTHAYDLAVEHKDEGHGYHYCNDSGYGPYIPAERDKALDHILIKNAPDGFVRRFERFAADYYMPLSDHLPVYIDIEY